MNFRRTFFNPWGFSFISSCLLFMVSFSNVLNCIKCICLFSLSDWCLFTGALVTHSGLFPRVLCHQTQSPFYRTPFSWEDPAAWVRSFTQNNCTCFCSGTSRPVVCWALIELISQVTVVGPQRSCTFGPTSQELKPWDFDFFCGDLKKKIQTSSGGRYQPWHFLLLKDIVFLVYSCSEAAGHTVLAFPKCLSSNSLPCATPQPHSWPKWAYRPASSWPRSILPSPSLSHTQAVVTSTSPLKIHEILEQIIKPKTLPLFFALLTFICLLRLDP